MSKKQNKKEDTISQLKKEEKKIKKETKEEEDEEEDDEEQDQNVVKEQTVQKADKPKNLKELFGSMGDPKPKPKKKETKPNKKKSEDEPKKMKFINSKGTGNADEKFDKNAKGSGAATKENQNMKHTRDYLEKDTKKEYRDEKEDIAKPKFVSNKKGDGNFVELNQSEDVSSKIYLFYFFFSY